MQACDMRVAVVTAWTKAVKYLMNKPKDQRFSARTVTDADVPLSNAFINNSGASAAKHPI